MAKKETIYLLVPVRICYDTQELRKQAISKARKEIYVGSLSSSGWSCESAKQVTVVPKPERTKRKGETK